LAATAAARRVALTMAPNLLLLASFGFGHRLKLESVVFCVCLAIPTASAYCACFLSNLLCDFMHFMISLMAQSVERRSPVASRQFISLPVE